jgi:VIT1/CCC1 family predicted Fe2+/Mn2+ transporter
MRKSHIKRVLNPIDRAMEVLCGLIMVLTFTSTLSVSQDGEADIEAMLYGSLGCNLAWGIIDAVMYLLSRLSEHSSELRVVRQAHSDQDPAKTRRAITAELPDFMKPIVAPEELEQIRLRLREQPEALPRPRLERNDWLGALGILFLVVFSTLPVVLPFLFVQDPHLALRISNVVAVTLLFLIGYLFGRETGHRPWLIGFSMVLFGLTLTGIAIVLGG